jgi:hypothetical protein
MMSTAHPLQNAPIAETAMTAFFMAFLSFALLAADAFSAGITVQSALGGVEVTSTTMAVTLAAAVSLLFAVLAVLLVTVFA